MKKIFSKSIEANIPKFYLFQIAWMFWLIYAINVVFFRANGISVFQVAAIDVIWAVAAFIMEVPTGILSDRWSRKYMLVLSGLSASVGFLIFSLTGSFIPFVIATIFMAGRHCFHSGTANALLYDSLKELKRENDFEKILGRLRLLGIISVSIAGIIGAFLAKSNIRLPFVLSIFASGLAALIALAFQEPKLHGSTGEVKLFEHIKKASRFVLTSPFIRFIFLYLILMDIAISYLDEYDQIYLALINFPLTFFGIWIALRRLLGGLGGFLAEKFKQKSSANIKTITMLMIMLALAMVVFGNKYIGLAAFLMIFPIWGIAEVLIYGEIHSQAESRQRATIESLMVFWGVLIDMPVRLGFGYISDAFGIKTGYLFVLLLLIIYLPYFLFNKSVLCARKKV